MEQVFSPSQDYKVLVRCFTYNQAKYIIDALNGFVMQKTDFPFVCLVMDDASTDGEQNVINSWMERECDMAKAENVEIEKSFITIVPHKANEFCTFAFYFLKENLYKTGGKTPMVAPWRELCEYEAICEGDDYWIDSSKLQIMVEYMDSHLDHSMCFHAFSTLNPSGTKISVHRYNKDVDECPIEDMILIGGGYAKLNAMLIRLSSYRNGYKEWTSNCPVGDLPLQLSLFVQGKVAYLNRIMSIYRVNSVGSWTSRMNGISKRRVHTMRIDRMWRDFDRWTQEKYHKAIIKKRILNVKNFLYRWAILSSKKSVME